MLSNISTNQITVKTEEGVTYEFPCYRWLASNEGDGELQRDLIPSLTFTDNETESGKVTEIIFSTACRQSFVAYRQYKYGKFTLYFEDQCHGALGVSDGRIKDIQLFASSSADETQQPFHARINKTVKGSKGGWCSAFQDNTEFIEVDLLKPFFISGMQAFMGKRLVTHGVEIVLAILAQFCPTFASSYCRQPSHKNIQQPLKRNTPSRTMYVSQ